MASVSGGGKYRSWLHWVLKAKSLSVAERKQREFCTGETAIVKTSIWPYELDTDVPYVVQALHESGG